MAYAQRTEVSAEKSKVEIARLLERHKAKQYATGIDYQKRQARVEFRLHDRIVRFLIALPDDGGRNRARYEQQERQRWRALLLVIKAKLEAVESAIETFEEAFLAQIVLPNDRTVVELMRPIITESYKTGRLKLPAAGETEG